MDGQTAQTHGRDMLSFSGQLKIYVAVEGCDMRKSFEGLSGLVQSRLEQDLRAGALLGSPQETEIIAR